jgi:hypothetical protein
MRAGILKQRTTDVDIKLYALQCMAETKSFEYSRAYLENLRGEIDVDNPPPLVGGDGSGADRRAWRQRSFVGASGRVVAPLRRAAMTPPPPSHTCL